MQMEAGWNSTHLARPGTERTAPNQLGVGVRGGAEAIAHAVSEAVKVHPSSWRQGAKAQREGGPKRRARG